MKDKLGMIICLFFIKFIEVLYNIFIIIFLVVLFIPLLILKYDSFNKIMDSLYKSIDE